MDMAKLGGFVTLVYFLALACGVIALFLPFWVHIESEEIPKNVTVIKTTHSGLWRKYDTYEIKENISSYKDQPWYSIVDSSTDTHGITAIKSMLIIGLAVLLVVIFISGCTRCCADGTNDGRMQTMFFAGAIGSVIAVIIAIAPIVYYTDVKKDYGFERTDLGWCFWMLVASSLAAFTAGIIGIFSFRRQKSASEEGYKSVKWYREYFRRLFP